MRFVQYSKLSTGGSGLLTENEKYAADVNDDNKIDAKDASIVLAYYSYLSTGGDEKFDVYIEKQKKKKRMNIARIRNNAVCGLFSGIILPELIILMYEAAQSETAYLLVSHVIT